MLTLLAAIAATVDFTLEAPVIAVGIWDTLARNSAGLALSAVVLAVAIAFVALRRVRHCADSLEHIHAAQACRWVVLHAPALLVSAGVHAAQVLAFFAARAWRRTIPATDSVRLAFAGDLARVVRVRLAVVLLWRADAITLPVELLPARRRADGAVLVVLL